MYKGTTPTLTLTFPDDVDLTDARVFVTFSKVNSLEIFTKETEDLYIDHNVIELYLTQEETLQLAETVLLQVNWLYSEGGKTKRACSNIIKLTIQNNLLKRELQ